MKRVLDLCVSLIGIAALAAIAPILALLIKLDSPGPVFFSQTRVGRGEHLFRCHKFRTLRTGTRQVPTHELTQSDVTRLGRILRSTKADELPQLVNVAFGQMSLVGPRPCLPTQTQLIAARRKRDVNSFRPGITGLAQILGVDMSDPERLSKIDAFYVKRQNLAFDFRILWATVFGGLRRS